MTDPFIIRLPATLANDPEVGPYFNYLGKVLNDLTIIRDGIADAGDITAITEYTPHATGAVAVLSEASTDLDVTAAALDALVDEVTSLGSELTDVKDQLNTVLQMLRDHGIIAT